MAAPTSHEPLNSNNYPETGNYPDGELPEEGLAHLKPDTYTQEAINSQIEHYVISPDSFTETLELGETDPERELQFQREMELPYGISYLEDEYASRYNMYFLNEDCVNNGENPIVYLSPLTSSPSQEQGRKALWQLSQRFPKRPIIAIGNDGTSDVKKTCINSERSSETTSFAVLHGIEEMLKEWEDRPAEIDLIGQSMGAVMAFEAANHMQEFDPDLKVDNLVLVEPPVESTGATELTRRMGYQEIKNMILHSSWKKRARLLGHVATNVAPRIMSKDVSANVRTYKRQVQYTAETPVQAAYLKEGIDASFITGEGDKLARFYDFLAGGSPSSMNHIKGLTVKGKEGHSDFLLNDESFGKAVEAVMND